MVGYMLRFSKKVEYALIALMDLSDIHEDLVTAKTVAQNYQMPYELLGKVMQTLTKKGLLTSVQGVKGGYVLRKSPDKISIKEVIEILEGSISITSCGVHSEDHPDCNLLSTCTIKSPMEIIQHELEKYFSSISLKDLRTSYYKTSSEPIQLTV